tara:strand:- start:16170 stop:16277 length:108 start_codon:yes stop_codon:yes gene_type:complete
VLSGSIGGIMDTIFVIGFIIAINYLAWWLIGKGKI